MAGKPKAMTERMSAAAFLAAKTRGGKASKYNAVRTQGPSPLGPRTYDSKAEMLMGLTLENERKSGGCVSWIPQPSMPCGVDENGRDVRYRADALVILSVNDDNTFVGKFIDRKGIETPTSRAKRAAVKAIYGLSVEILR